MASYKQDLKVCLYCARYKGEEFNVRPLGISYLASYLLDKGVVAAGNLRIVDNYEEAIAFQPDVIGVSSVSQVIADARDFARRCKEATNCYTILGGYHVSSVPRRLPDEFDIGVIGEGEETFFELLKRYAGGSFFETDLNNIAGICFRGEGGIIQLSPLREQIVDIDALPWPVRHKSYSKEEPVFTSRGCPFRCTFCASQRFWRGHTRFRSADSVVREIEYIVERYQPHEIAILDDLWMADKQRFKNIVNQLVELGIPKKVSFLYFNHETIPLETFRGIVSDIKGEFISRSVTKTKKSLRMKISGVFKRYFHRLADALR